MPNLLGKNILILHLFFLTLQTLNLVRNLDFYKSLLSTHYMLNTMLSSFCGMAHLILLKIIQLYDTTTLLTIAVEFVALVSMNSLTKFSR